MGQEPDRKFFLEEFRAISHAISTYEDLNLLISHLAEGMTRTFEGKGCCIMLLDDRENQLFTVSNYGISEKYLRKGPVFVDDKYSAFVKGKPVYIENIQEDPRIQYYLSETKGFHDEDIDSLKVIATHLGLVIENSGLKNFLDKVKMAMESLPVRMLEGL